MMGLSSVAFLLFLPAFPFVELLEFAAAAICFALLIATFLISPPFIARALINVFVLFSSKSGEGRGPSLFGGQRNPSFGGKKEKKRVKKSKEKVGLQQGSDEVITVTTARDGNSNEDAFTGGEIDKATDDTKALTFSG